MITQDLMWAVGLVLLACALVFLEFTLPTGGLLGVGAVIAAGAALFLGFQDSWSSGLCVGAAITVLLPVMLAVAIRVWPHTPIGRRILNLPADDLAPNLHSNPRIEHLQKLVGKVGFAKTDLLPGGLVEIDGTRYDAVATGAAIDAGQTIVVSKVEAGKIRVRQTEKSPSTTERSDEVPDETSLTSKSLEELGLDDLGDPLA